MPKVKDKLRSGRNGEGSDDDESYIPTQASQSGRSQQATATQVDRSLAQLSLSERTQIINNIIRYLLITDQKKVPIKRADIVKHVLKDHGRAFAPLMKEASDKLRDVFGIDASFSERAKGYILINTLDNVYNNPHQTWSPEDNAKLGLVMVILTVIFMKGNVIDDETLWDMLKRLGVDTESSDQTFDDVRHLVTVVFVRQGYLEVEREPGDPPRLFFRWGPRAHAETSKQQALDFINQIYGSTSQERWTAQLRDIAMTETAGNNVAATD